jgi:HEAT repeat protein
MMFTRKIKFQIVVSISLTAALVVAAVRSVRGRQQEPLYEGKRLSAWLQDLAPSFSGDMRRAKVQEAVLALGTNALTPLADMLRARDHLPTKILIGLNRLGANRSFFSFHLTMAADQHARALAAYGLLGPIANPDIPVLSRMLVEESSPKVRTRAASALHCIRPAGAAAAAAMPSLTAATRDKDSGVRYESVFALVVIRPEPEQLVPVLIERLTDPFAATRELAQRGLRAAGDKAIPALWDASRTNQLADQVLRELQHKPLKRGHPLLRVGFRVQGELG